MRVPRSKHTADEMRRILEAGLSLPAGMKRREGAHARLQNDLAELGDRLGYFAQTEWDIEPGMARGRGPYRRRLFRSCERLHRPGTPRLRSRLQSQEKIDREARRAARDTNRALDRRLLREAAQGGHRPGSVRDSGPRSAARRGAAIASVSPR